MKKDSKKGKDSSPQNSRFGVVLERIDSNVQQIAEGHVVLNEKVERIDKKLEKRTNEADYKFDILVKGQKEHNERMGKMEDRAAKIENQLYDLAKNINHLSGAMLNKFSDVNYQLERVRSELVKREEFTLLEKRVLELEKRQTKRG